MTISVIFSKATEPAEAKFLVEPPDAKGTKLYSNVSCHISIMVPCPYMVKYLNMLFSGGSSWMALKLDM